MLEWLPAWLLEEADMPPPNQLAEEELEENSLDPAPHQGRLSDPAETTVVDPPVLDKTKKSYPVVIPYVKGVSEQVRRVMRGYRVKVYFKPTNTLKQILVRPKDKVIKEMLVQYTTAAVTTVRIHTLGRWGDLSSLDSWSKKGVA